MLDDDINTNTADDTWDDEEEWGSPPPAPTNTTNTNNNNNNNNNNHNTADDTSEPTNDTNEPPKPPKPPSEKKMRMMRKRWSRLPHLAEDVSTGKMSAKDADGVYLDWHQERGEPAPHSPDRTPSQVTRQEVCAAITSAEKAGLVKPVQLRGRGHASRWALSWHVPGWIAELLAEKVPSDTIKHGGGPGKLGKQYYVFELHLIWHIWKELCLNDAHLLTY